MGDSEQTGNQRSEVLTCYSGNTWNICLLRQTDSGLRKCMIRGAMRSEGRIKKKKIGEEGIALTCWSGTG